MKLVIVESPAKAKTINKYLGSGYEVISSFGHIRNLISKSGSVLPDQDFLMKYEISEKSSKHVDIIVKSAKKAGEIYLATDPDREGEAISWHIIQVLQEKKIVKDVSKFKRIAFNEITKRAVLEAISNPRTVDIDLVNAQQARGALDYLVGFTLSPILWRKLPGCKSAGRVQSVALRLICEKESEIERFVSKEFWDISLNVVGDSKKTFTAKITHIDDTKLQKFSITNQKQAEEIVNKLKARKFHVNSIEKKKQKRKPAAPFITSSMQQESARKLGFSARKTMQVAQKLYEGIDLGGETVGLITYMRTDGVTLADSAVESIRSIIKKKYGEDYLPNKPITYKSKSKNAQEAHEAIRPTNIELLPDKISKNLDADQLKLYNLIWKRTVACQMESVILDLVGANIISDDKNFIARATGSTITFDGFYKVYQEGVDDTKEETRKMLPPLKEGEEITVKKINPDQHFTEPPPRYSEASLVKKLEELGIGRPSTYATIISVLQDRKYAVTEKKRFIPSDLGRFLTVFLVKFFEKYVQYDFTADLETDLDKVAGGSIAWKDLLYEFWGGFNNTIEEVKKQEYNDVMSYLEQSLEGILFGDKISTPELYSKNKKCPECDDGKLNLKLGKFGAFLACNNYPKCEYRRNVRNVQSSEEGDLQDDKKLGVNENGLIVTLKRGPYGWYVQLGDEPIDSKKKPKRISLPTAIKPENTTLDYALKLLSLPIHVGKHLESGEEISMSIGRFGPYLKYQGKFISIPKAIEPFTISPKEAMSLIEKKAEKAKKKDTKKKKTTTTKVTRKK